LSGLSAQHEESWEADWRPIRAGGISIMHGAHSMPETIATVQRIGDLEHPILCACSEPP